MSKRKGVQNWAEKRVEGKYSPIQYRYYIFCEGEKTEPHYFEGFKKQIEKNAIYKNKIFLNIEGLGSNTIHIVNFAEKYVKKSKFSHKEKIWCVFDKDNFPKDDFNMAVSRIAQLNKEQNKVQYSAAWSNQCIEYWFLLHFCYYDSDNDRKHYIDCLNKHYKYNGLPKYAKNSQNIFNTLYKFGIPKKAIEYARKRLEECQEVAAADKAPATNVHILVEELSQFLPDELKDKFI